MNCDILEHEKRTIETALFPCLIIFPLSFYRFTHTLFGETPILFGKTLYNLAKLPGFAKSFILFGKRTPERKFTHSRM